MNKKTRSTESKKWRHTCSSVDIAWTNEQKVAVTSYGRNKNHDDEIKKHSRTSPEEQFKEFSLTKQTSRPKTDYERNGKTILKKSDKKKFKKTRKSMSKCRMSRKKIISEKEKFGSYKKLGLEWTMNGLENPFRKKSDPKNRKTVKIKVKLPHVNKKPLARKLIFVQTPFSHSTLKLERKNFTPQNHSLFRSISCFGVTKITTPIWLQKSWKCVNRS